MGATRKMKRLFLWPIFLITYPLVLLIRGMVWVAMQCAEMEEELKDKKTGGDENGNK